MNSPHENPKLEVADIFKKYGHLLPKMPAGHYKVISAIKNCRTGVLGGHHLKCGSCSFKKQAYNSCRNRHCPKCQFTTRQKWIENRIEDLLPCQYFHVVFTVPSELRALILQNKKVCYGILFRAASETLKEVAKNPDRLGAEIGCIGVLHTWSQQLTYHPHIHFIVPGGGLNKAKTKWLPCKQDYLLPVRILSQVFRGKILSYLQEAFDQDQFNFFGSTQQLCHPGIFNDLMINCAAKAFNVDSRKPFNGPEAVIKYLGQYTHRIAISNYRLVKLEGEMVHFKYRDPEDPSKKKVMCLHVKEFMRRFLLHVLPKGFVRIRHFGMLGGKLKKMKIEIIRKLCGIKDQIKAKLEDGWSAILFRATEIIADKCPKCLTGILEKTRTIRSLLSSA